MIIKQKPVKIFFNKQKLAVSSSDNNLFYFRHKRKQSQVMDKPGKDLPRFSCFSHKWIKSKFEGNISIDSRFGQKGAGC